MKKAILPIIVFIFVSVILLFVFSNFFRDSDSIEQDLLDNTAIEINEEFEIDLRDNICRQIGADYVSEFQEGIAFILDDYEVKYIDRQGRQIFTDSAVIDVQTYFPEEFEEVEEDFDFLIEPRQETRTLEEIDNRPVDLLNITNFDNDYLVFNNDDGYFIVNKAGVFLNDEGFQYAEIFSGELALIRTEQGYNYLTQNGNIVSPKYFTDARSFVDGVAVVADNTGYYLINSSLQRVSPSYTFIEDIKDGYAPAVKSNNKKVLLNSDGVEVNGVEYDNFLRYSEGVWVVVDQGVVNYMDIEGNIIDLNLDRTTLINIGYEFNDGIAVVQLKNGGNPDIDGKFIFIRKDGTKLTETLFHDAYNFRNGFALVASDEAQYSYIDLNGNLISDERFFFGSSFSESGIVLVEGNQGEFFYIDNTGNRINNEVYNDAYDFEFGLAQVVTDSGDWYLINTNGERLAGPYNYIDNYYNGIALIEKKTGRFSYINQNGNEITNLDFITAFSFHSGLGKVILDNGEERYLTNIGQFFCQ